VARLIPGVLGRAVVAVPIVLALVYVLATQHWLIAWMNSKMHRENSTFSQLLLLAQVGVGLVMMVAGSVAIMRGGFLSPRSRGRHRTLVDTPKTTPLAADTSLAAR